MLGRNSNALKLAQRGLAFSQAFGDQFGVTFGQMTLGIVAAAQWRYAVASAHLNSTPTLSMTAQRFLKHAVNL